MARDRQRAKQRRRRQDGAQQPRGRRERRIDEIVEDGELEGTTPGSHKDAGLEDVVDDRGPEGTTPAPDPLKHSSSFVDEAKLAEAGAGVPEPDGRGLEDEADAPGLAGDPDAAPDFDEIDFDFGGAQDERAPDAVEGDVPVRGRPRAGSVAAEEAHPERGRRRERTRVVAFLGHCVDELKRVQWPNRNQTFQGTAVTLGFVVLAGGYLGLMDAIWKPIVDAIL
jgi:preprotein translocase SecE subunit